MKTILVYEDGNVNEYEVCFDQKYMNACLEDYRKNFSILKAGNILCSKDSYQNNIEWVYSHFNQVIINSVSGSDNNDYLMLDYIGAINPVIYNIFGRCRNFTIDNLIINEVLDFCEEDKKFISKDDKKMNCRDEIIMPAYDFYNLDEKENLDNNIASLLEDVSLQYVGMVNDVSDEDMFLANRCSVFVKKFGVKKLNGKILKK